MELARSDILHLENSICRSIQRIELMRRLKIVTSTLFAVYTCTAANLRAMLDGKLLYLEPLCNTVVVVRTELGAVPVEADAM